MKIDYDPEADALYISLLIGEVHDTREVSADSFVDVDEAGAPLGIEILQASKRFSPDDLTAVTVNIGRLHLPAG